MPNPSFKRTGYRLPLNSVLYFFIAGGCGNRVPPTKTRGFREVARNQRRFMEKNVIKIPGFFKDALVFTESFIEDKCTRIYYNDIKAISYYSLSQIINLIPTYDDYEFSVKSNSDEIKITLSTAFKIGNRKRKDAFSQIVLLSNRLIFPHLFNYLLNQIIDNPKYIIIGNLKVTQENIVLKRILQSGKILNLNHFAGTNSYQGNVNIYYFKANGDNKAHEFASISMREDNAVILPYILKYLYKIR